MEEKHEAAHALPGPHRAMGELPAGFVGLRLRMHPEGPGVEVGRPQAIVGRHSEADVRLPAADVSRRHCRLFFEAGFWRVQDFKSLNGTYVNDERVVEATLYDGDLLRVGEFVFRVDYASPSTQQEQEVLRSIANVLPRKAS